MLRTFSCVLGMILGIVVVGCQPADRTAAQNSNAATPPAGETTPTTQPTGYFLPLTVGKALKRARAEEKPVFVYIYRPQGTLCEQFEHEVLSDPEVAALLREQTLPVKVNVKENRAFCQYYGVAGFPTCLVLRGDRTVIGAFTPPIKRDDFFERISYYAAGKSDVDTAREAIIIAHYRLANALVVAGKTREAVDELFYALHQGETLPDFFEEKGRNIILALVYRVAVVPDGEAFINQKLQEAEGRLRQGQGSLADVKAFSAFNQASNNQAATLALYDYVKEHRANDPLLPALKEEALFPMLEAKRYKEAGEGVDVAKRVDNIFRQLRRRKPSPDVYEGSSLRRHKDNYEKELANRINKYYYLLLGLGREEEAQQLAERLLKEAPGPASRNGLAWVGYLTGHPTKQHQRWAFQAKNQTAGADYATVDTVARILVLRGKKPEAVKILQDSLTKVRQPDQHAFLKQLLDDIQAGKLDP